MDIDRLIGIPRHLEFRGIALDRKPIMRELHTVEAVKTAPEKIFAPLVFDVELVDGIRDTDLIADEKRPEIPERPRGRVGYGYPDAVLMYLSPFRKRVVKNPMIANAVNVRRPYTASAINKAGTAFLCESIADVLPSDEITRPHDRHETDVLGGI